MLRLFKRAEKHATDTKQLATSEKRGKIFNQSKCRRILVPRNVMAVQSAGKLAELATIKRREKRGASAKRKKLENQRRETWEKNYYQCKDRAPKNKHSKSAHKPRQVLVSPDR